MRVYVNKKFEIIKVFWNILSIKRRRQIIFLQIINLLCALSELCNILIIRFFLDGFIDNSLFKRKFISNYVFDKIAENQLVLIFGIVTILFISSTGFLRILSVHYGFKIGGLLSLDLGTKVYYEVINRSYSWHINKNSSEIIGILSNDIERLRESINSFLSLQINSLIILFIGIPLFLIEPKLMLILFSVILISFGTIYRSSRELLIKEGFDNTKSFQNGIKLINESLGSIKDILIDNNQKFFLENYINKFKKYHISFARLQAKYQSPRFFVESILICLIIIIAIFINYSNNFARIDISIIGIVFIGIYKLLVPFQQCSMAVSTIKSNSKSWEKIKPYFYRKKTKEINNTKSLKIEPFGNNPPKENTFIEIKNLSYKHINRNWIIKDLNFSINKGQIIGFVGYSGSGKTTFADLISGLLKPVKGNIFVNGKDINISRNNLRNWQNNFSLVPQNIYLIEDTIIKNIAFGVPISEINFDKVVKVSKAACIHETVMHLPNGYEEIIGEKGNKLSGGQIQRIGIARALYKNSKCIIFDESTNALDIDTERILIEGLRSNYKDITMIYIAHRLSTIKNCDFLVFFERDGKKIIGNYEELLKIKRFRDFLNANKNK